MAATEMDQVSHATTKHAIQALFFAVSAQNPGKDITKIIQMQMKDPFISFKKDKVGPHADSCEKLETFMREVVKGLPKLKDTPGTASALMKEGMNIKENYKAIVSKSKLGVGEKAKALAKIAANVFQMAKIGPLVKKNCNKVKQYYEDIKGAGAYLTAEKAKIEEIWGALMRGW